MACGLQDGWQKNLDWLIRGYARMVTMLEEAERDAPMVMSNKNLADIEFNTRRLQAIADRTRIKKNGPRTSD